MWGRDRFLRRCLWFKAVQPVKELCQHLQSLLLASLHCVAIRASLLHIRTTLKVLLLERNGVVEEELRSVFESIRDGVRVRGEILVEGTRHIGEQEGNIIGRALGEDGGESGECRVGSISDDRDSAIGEHEDGSDRVGFLLDLSRNTFLGGLVLRNTAIIDEPRSVEDANLRKRLPMLATFIIGGTYHYAVSALEFINAG